MPSATERKSAEPIEIPSTSLLNRPTLVPLAKTRRISRWLLWLMAFVVVVAGGVIWRTRVQNQVSYETVPVERGSVQSSITATGTLNPVVSVQVGSQVSGNIKALYADFNTRVKKGQLVALIDPQIFQAQVDQAEGVASAAQSARVAAQAQVAKANADLAGAVAGRANMQSVAAKDRANALNAEAQWRRIERLFRQGILSRQDRDSAKAASDAARAQVAADQAQIEAADHNISSSRALRYVALTQSRAAEAQQRQAESALAQMKINLAHTRIIAPVSGIGKCVGRRDDEDRTRIFRCDYGPVRLW